MYQEERGENWVVAMWHDCQRRAPVRGGEQKKSRTEIYVWKGLLRFIDLLEVVFFVILRSLIICGAVVCGGGLRQRSGSIVFCGRKVREKELGVSARATIPNTPQNFDSCEIPSLPLQPDVQDNDQEDAHADKQQDQACKTKKLPLDFVH